MKAVLPRFPLATLPTPLVRAERLEKATGGPPVYIKRDDLAGFAAAGHKARPLEFLVGAALAEGCDVVVTGGGPSSNFIAAAAAAASAAGLDCELVLFGDRPPVAHPNLALALACGAIVRYTGDPDRDRVDTEVYVVADELAAAGRRPYPMPRGGAVATGTVGMAVATEELAGQLPTEPEAVVVASGSGTTCAGLAVGTALAGAPWRVVGASVSRPLEQARLEIAGLAAHCAALLDVPPPPADVLQLVDARGPGHHQPSEAGERAAAVALRTEGLLLDPTYTAKSFAVLLEIIEAGASGPIVFWHTGGLLSAAGHLVDP